MRMLWALLTLACLTLAPVDRVEAQQTDPVAFWSATTAVSVPMLAVDAVLVGMAIDAWVSRGTGLEEAWAVIELVWGAVHIAGAGVAIGVSTLAYDPVPLALTFATPLAAFGAYFVTHALLSLYGESPPVRGALQLSLAPRRDGAEAIVFGTF